MSLTFAVRSSPLWNWFIQLRLLTCSKTLPSCVARKVQLPCSISCIRLQEWCLTSRTGISICPVFLSASVNRARLGGTCCLSPAVRHRNSSKKQQQHIRTMPATDSKLHDCPKRLFEVLITT